jgi:hypothetical protein
MTSPVAQLTWKLLAEVSVTEPPPPRLMVSPTAPNWTPAPLIHTASVRPRAKVIRLVPTSAASMVMTLTVEFAEYGCSRT